MNVRISCRIRNPASWAGLETDRQTVTQIGAIRKFEEQIETDKLSECKNIYSCRSRNSATVGLGSTVGRWEGVEGDVDARDHTVLHRRLRLNPRILHILISLVKSGVVNCTVYSVHFSVQSCTTNSTKKLLKDLSYDCSILYNSFQVMSSWKALT